MEHYYSHHWYHANLDVFWSGADKKILKELQENEQEKIVDDYKRKYGLYVKENTDD